MTTYQALTGSLKTILRERKIRYRELSEALSVSEITVKRIMTAKDGPLGNIESICDYLKISVLDVLAKGTEEAEKLYILSDEEEKFFSKNLHYLYFYSLLQEYNYSVEEIKKRFSLTQKSITLYLKKLDELGLIEWHPKDKIKIKTTGGFGHKRDSVFGWKLAKTLVHNLGDQVATPTFHNIIQNKDGLLINGETQASKKTIDEYLVQLRDIANQFRVRANQDKKLRKRSELVDCTLLVTLLPGHYTFDSLHNI